MPKCSQCYSDNVPAAVYCERCGSAIDRPASGRSQSAGPVVIRVGREPDNDVVLDYPMVSGHHLRLTLEGNAVLVEDLGSTNGTFLGEQPVSRATVHVGDVLYLGTYRVTVRRLVGPSLAKMGHESRHLLKPGETSIGRDADNAIFLDHQLVSWRHARVLSRDGDLFLEDLGSTNGTFLNGESLGRVQKLRSGDQVVVGPFYFEVEAQALVQIDSWRCFTLDLRNVGVVLDADRHERRKTLLEEISFVLLPGEFCGLMGLAGSGKTTLLKAANGYLRPTAGNVYINGLNLYGHYDLFRHAIGYVPQEDIFHKELTVGQALTYAARLRLGQDLPREEIVELVGNLLERLAMFDANRHIRDTRIAHISGGQKRRLNIAIELLTDPALFFLDEPTSGLSSEDARLVMKVLRQMAEEGKTILMTLHQPSLETYAMMDNVIFLHKGGRLAYFGPTVPDSLVFTNPEMDPEDAARHPDNALRGLEAQEPISSYKHYRASPYYQEFVLGRQRQSRLRDEGEALGRPPFTFNMKQWRVLHNRNVAVKIKDRMNSLILLLQAPVIATLIALVFSCSPEDAYKTAPTALFLMVIAAVWFGCSNAARDICGEWVIYCRERMFNLEIFPYLLSKVSVGSIICAIQCLILLIIVGPACHLSASWLFMFFMLWFTAMAGVALGLLISAFAAPFKKSNEIAVGLIPIVMLPMVILGGVVKPFREMDTAARMVAATMVTRWSFDAMLIAEAHATIGSVSVKTPEGESRKKKEDLILEVFHEKNDVGSPIDGMGIVIAQSLLFFSAALVLLGKRDRM